MNHVKFQFEGLPTLYSGTGKQFLNAFHFKKIPANQDRFQAIGKSKHSNIH
jgi:hypothetical protein